MTTASKNVYKKYKEKRLSDRAKIYDVMKYNKTSLIIGFTFKEMARFTGISIGNCQKRMSDLFKQGKLKINGIRNEHSVYYEANERKRMTLSQAYREALSLYCDSKQQDEIKEYVKSKI